MVTREKNEEYRFASGWIKSRLRDKKSGRDKYYDVIKFVNGYGADKPYFICEFKGWAPMAELIITKEYSNGLTFTIDGLDHLVIYCGDIIERGNLKDSAFD